MPIFEYACEKCGTQDERLESSSCTAEPPACKMCGDRMQRIISPSSFRLYGSGFYKPNQR
jgi:putative FmdB family regulatory protein